MQAIVTKYLGPTNSRGGRIKATCDAGSVTLSYQHGLGLEENHRAACRALILKLDWTVSSQWVTGYTQHGYVHTMVMQHTAWEA